MYLTRLCIFCFVLTTSCAEGLQASFGTGGDGGAGGKEVSVSVSSTNVNVDVATTGGLQACIPGSTQLCNGPGACVGAQSCLNDGSGYEPCDCSTGSTASNGTTTATTASTTGGGGFSCDPQSPGAICGPGKQCIPQGNSTPVCAPAGSGNIFDLCVDFSQCLPGLDCVNDGINSCCMAWCRLGYNDCSSGFTCVEVLGNPSVNGVAYGVCWDGYPCIP